MQVVYEFVIEHLRGCILCNSTRLNDGRCSNELCCHTVCRTINVENRWRRVFSLSYGGIKTSNQVRLMGVIKTHQAHLVRASDSNGRLRKNFKTAGIWDRGLESGILTSQPSIKMSNFNPFEGSDHGLK